MNLKTNMSVLETCYKAEVLTEEAIQLLADNKKEEALEKLKVLLALLGKQNLSKNG